MRRHLPRAGSDEGICFDGSYPTAYWNGTADASTSTGMTDPITAAALTRQIPTSLFTTKDDLVTASGSGTVERVPVVSNGRLLESWSTAPTGLRWSTTQFLNGTGSPEGVVAAPLGTTYTDTAAVTGAIKWVNALGARTTGWRVVYGDTGWRSVPMDAASVAAGGSVSSIRIRRSGDLVEPIVIGASWQQGQGSAAIYSPPSDFIASASLAFYQQFRVSNALAFATV